MAAMGSRSTVKCLPGGVVLVSGREDEFHLAKTKIGKSNLNIDAISATFAWTSSAICSDRASAGVVCLKSFHLMMTKVSVL